MTPVQSFGQGTDIIQLSSHLFLITAFFVARVYTLFLLLLHTSLVLDKNDDKCYVSRAALWACLNKQHDVWNRIENKEALTLLGGRDHRPWTKYSPYNIYRS